MERYGQSWLTHNPRTEKSRVTANIQVAEARIGKATLILGFVATALLVSRQGSHV